MPRQERGRKKRKNDEEKLSPTEKTDTLVVPLTGSRSIIHAFQPGIIHSLSPTAFTFTLNLHLPQDGKPRPPQYPLLFPSLPPPSPFTHDRLLSESTDPAIHKSHTAEPRQCPVPPPPYGRKCPSRRGSRRPYGPNSPRARSTVGGRLRDRKSKIEMVPQTLARRRQVQVH